MSDVADVPAGFYVNFGKRTLDTVLAAAALVATAPLLLIIAALVRIDSAGPVLFRQERVGRRLKPFVVVKFRTMDLTTPKPFIEVVGREAGVTRVGYWLRRFKIDELPQLWNVLVGDMSLVGPRPTVTETVRSMPPEGMARFSVRPGLAGLAQVNGNIHLTWPERLQWDVAYVQRMTLRLDLSIMVRTLAIVAFGDRALGLNLPPGEHR